MTGTPFPGSNAGNAGGILLDDAFFTHALGNARSAGPSGLAGLPQSRVACPSDGESMRSLLHTGVEIDICPQCRSIWLDRSEYEKIVAIGQMKKQDQAASYASRYTDPDFNFANFDPLDLADVVRGFVR